MPTVFRIPVHIEYHKQWGINQSFILSSIAEILYIFFYEISLSRRKKSGTANPITRFEKIHVCNERRNRRGGVEVERSPRSPVATDLSLKNR